MKEYPCPKSLTKMCQYGGNKRYNYGFMSGTSSYCRKDKKWVHDLKDCPLDIVINKQIDKWEKDYLNT